jgi:signal transduction histidine kinase
MGSRTKVLLVYALGGLLVLLAATGAFAITVSERIRAGEAVLRSRVVERSGWLEQIRGGIYQSGTVARDYVLEPEGPEAPALLRELSRLERDTKRALDLYTATATGQTPVAANLRGEVTVYWKVLGLMVEVAHKRQTPAMDAYFRRQLSQRRGAMLRIADGIGMAVERELEAGEANLTGMYNRFRMMLAGALALVVAAGLALSVYAARRIVRLETEARALSAQAVRAQEQERRTIARELHDEVGQALTGLMLEVGNAASADGEGLRPRLASITRNIEQALEAVRRIALSLRPSMLDDLGLVAALEWQARELARQSGLSIRVSAEDSAGDLPDAHRTCIFRVAQEALVNCMRHSEAKHVRVGLLKTDRSVSLQVEDDGKGFATARTRGLGLLGMEERVAQLGGRFRIHSEPGKGATVTAELPV